MLEVGVGFQQGSELVKGKGAEPRAGPEDLWSGRLPVWIENRKIEGGRENEP
jgi:hypothetical protein